MQRSLMECSREHIIDMMKGWGEPAYRTAQVWEWLQRGVRPAEMRNIPAALRERLASYPWGGASITAKRLSTRDGTVKYLFALEDGECVEGVLMRYHHGNTLCLSTQVGCRMSCAFCASTLDGLTRNLYAGEMLSQVQCVEQDERAAGERPKQQRAVTNLVLMGSGEPLDNFENVLSFLKRAVSPDGLGISARNISLSTCGLVPEIFRLMQEAPPVTLCISLHAHRDDMRDRLMPMNKKYPIRQVVEAADAYAKHTGRRVIFEYALIDGVNASEEDAQALAALVKGLLCHVNLIPLNPVAERGLTGVSRKQAILFETWLQQRKVSATLRREMGTDIEGACGQLRRRILEEERAKQEE